MLAPTSMLWNCSGRCCNRSREAWGDPHARMEEVAPPHTHTQNPFQMLLLLLSFPTQTFNQQNPARRGTGDTNRTVLTITCFLLGLGSSSLAEGLKDFPLEREKHIAELKIHHLGTGKPHSGQGAPSLCQDRCAHLPPLPL